MTIVRRDRGGIPRSAGHSSLPHSCLPAAVTRCGHSTIAILQSLDSWLHGRSHLATPPLIACVPKWVLARDSVPNANVKFENSTTAWAPVTLGLGVPPRMQIVTGDGLPKGGLPPFPVT